ncbi:MAG TPA: DUF177 domain-containing protein [Beijerinckiaceae bacterium]|nr:DUF177 domain-containing protein [Beijerinckiaceae bacterium]
MTPESVGPLSRPVSVDRLPPEGAEVAVVATREECDALARDFKLPAIGSLEGRYRVTGGPQRARVSGRVRAAITQICVVTLEPFDSVVEEEVEVDFAETEAARERPDGETDFDPPDEIVGGRIDLGALTAEFLALGLDPYPRKPGVAFEPQAEGVPDDSPFAALKRLKSES